MTLDKSLAPKAIYAFTSLTEQNGEVGIHISLDAASKANYFISLRDGARLALDIENHIKQALADPEIPEDVKYLIRQDRWLEAGRKAGAL